MNKNAEVIIPEPKNYLSIPNKYIKIQFTYNLYPKTLTNYDFYYSIKF